MVGILVSSWDDLFSGAMLVSGCVYFCLLLFFGMENMHRNRPVKIIKASPVRWGSEIFLDS